MDLQSLYLFCEIGIVLFLIIGFTFLFALSIIVHDFGMIKQNPLLFIVETFLVGLLPALPILFFVVSRGIPFEKAVAWVYGVGIKFAIFHVLFQISGFYTFMFA